MDKKEQIAIMVLIGVVSFGLGVMVHDRWDDRNYTNDQITDTVIEYMYLKGLPPTIGNRITPNSTVESIQWHYELYPYLGRTFIKGMVSEVCGR